MQQLQELEARKMAMAEQKLAEQARLSADLDVRLQAACAPLDCSAGRPECCFHIPLFPRHLILTDLWFVTRAMCE